VKCRPLASSRLISYGNLTVRLIAAINTLVLVSQYPFLLIINLWNMVEFIIFKLFKYFTEIKNLTLNLMSGLRPGGYIN